MNCVPVLFPYEDSVPYHLYWKVLNAKEHGVPQNRERVFIIGVRDDEDNSFRFPIEEHLTKRLKDVLEEDVNDKYLLSDKLIKGFIAHSDKHKAKGNGFEFKPKNENDLGNCLRANGALCATDNILKIQSKIRRLTPRECFRLMDFPDSFTWTVSDSQAYKQAGNSIVVNVLYKIISKLKL